MSSQLARLAGIFNENPNQSNQQKHDLYLGLPQSNYNASLGREQAETALSQRSLIPRGLSIVTNGLPNAGVKIRPISEWKFCNIEEVVRDALLTNRVLQGVQHVRIRMPAALSEADERESLQLAWDFFRESAGAKVYTLLNNSETDYLMLSCYLLSLYGESEVNYFRHLLFNTGRKALRAKLHRHLSHLTVPAWSKGSQQQDSQSYSKTLDIPDAMLTSSAPSDDTGSSVYFSNDNLDTTPVPALDNEEHKLMAYALLLERLYPNPSYHVAYARNKTKQLSLLHPMLPESALILTQQPIALPELAPPPTSQDLASSSSPLLSPPNAAVSSPIPSPSIHGSASARPNDLPYSETRQSLNDMKTITQHTISPSTPGSNALSPPQPNLSPSSASSSSTASDSTSSTVSSISSFLSSLSLDGFLSSMARDELIGRPRKRNRRNVLPTLVISPPTSTSCNPLGRSDIAEDDSASHFAGAQLWTENRLLEEISADAEWDAQRQDPTLADSNDEGSSDDSEAEEKRIALEGDWGITERKRSFRRQRRTRDKIENKSAEVLDPTKVLLESMPSSYGSPTQTDIPKASIEAMSVSTAEAVVAGAAAAKSALLARQQGKNPTLTLSGVAVAGLGRDQAGLSAASTAKLTSALASSLAANPNLTESEITALYESEKEKERQRVKSLRRTHRISRAAAHERKLKSSTDLSSSAHLDNNMSLVSSSSTSSSNFPALGIPDWSGIDDRLTQKYSLTPRQQFQLLAAVRQALLDQADRTARTHHWLHSNRYFSSGLLSNAAAQALANHISKRTSGTLGSSQNTVNALIAMAGAVAGMQVALAGALRHPVTSTATTMVTQSKSQGRGSGTTTKKLDAALGIEAATALQTNVAGKVSDGAVVRALSEHLQGMEPDGLTVSTVADAALSVLGANSEDLRPLSSEEGISSEDDSGDSGDDAPAPVKITFYEAPETNDDTSDSDSDLGLDYPDPSHPDPSDPDAINDARRGRWAKVFPSRYGFFPRKETVEGRLHWLGQVGDVDDHDTTGQGPLGQHRSLPQLDKHYIDPTTLLRQLMPSNEGITDDNIAMTVTSTDRPSDGEPIAFVSEVVSASQVTGNQGDQTPSSPNSATETTLTIPTLTTQLSSPPSPLSSPQSPTSPTSKYTDFCVPCLYVSSEGGNVSCTEYGSDDAYLHITLAQIASWTLETRLRVLFDRKFPARDLACVLYRPNPTFCAAHPSAPQITTLSYSPLMLSQVPAHFTRHIPQSTLLSMSSAIPPLPHPLSCWQSLTPSAVGDLPGNVFIALLLQNPVSDLLFAGTPPSSNSTNSTPLSSSISPSSSSATTSISRVFFDLPMNARVTLVRAATQLIYAVVHNDSKAISAWVTALSVRDANVSPTGQLQVPVPSANPVLFAICDIVYAALPLATTAIRDHLVQCLARRGIFLPFDLPPPDAPVMFAGAVALAASLLQPASSSHTDAISRRASTATPLLDFTRLLVRLVQGDLVFYPHTTTQADDQPILTLSTSAKPLAFNALNNKPKRRRAPLFLSRSRGKARYEGDDTDPLLPINRLRPKGDDPDPATSHSLSATPGESCVDLTLLLPVGSLSAFHVFVIRNLAAREHYSLLQTYLAYYSLEDFSSLQSSPLPLYHGDSLNTSAAEGAISALMALPKSIVSLRDPGQWTGWAAGDLYIRENRFFEAALANIVVVEHDRALRSRTYQQSSGTRPFAGYEFASGPYSSIFDDYGRPKPWYLLQRDPTALICLFAPPLEGQGVAPSPMGLLHYLPTSEHPLHAWTDSDHSANAEFGRAFCSYLLQTDKNYDLQVLGSICAYPFVGAGFKTLHVEPPSSDSPHYVSNHSAPIPSSPMLGGYLGYWLSQGPSLSILTHLEPLLNKYQTLHHALFSFPPSVREVRNNLYKKEKTLGLLATFRGDTDVDSLLGCLHGLNIGLFAPSLVTSHVKSFSEAGDASLWVMDASDSFLNARNVATTTDRTHSPSPTQSPTNSGSSHFSKLDKLQHTLDDKASTHVVFTPPKDLLATSPEPRLTLIACHRPTRDMLLFSGLSPSMRPPIPLFSAFAALQSPCVRLGIAYYLRQGQPTAAFHLALATKNGLARVPSWLRSKEQNTDAITSESKESRHSDGASTGPPSHDSPSLALLPALRSALAMPLPELEDIFATVLATAVTSLHDTVIEKACLAFLSLCNIPDIALRCILENAQRCYVYAYVIYSAGTASLPQQQADTKTKSRLTEDPYHVAALSLVLETFQNLLSCASPWLAFPPSLVQGLHARAPTSLEFDPVKELVGQATKWFTSYLAGSGQMAGALHNGKLTSKLDLPSTIQAHFESFDFDKGSHPVARLFTTCFSREEPWIGPVQLQILLRHPATYLEHHHRWLGYRTKCEALQQQVLLWGPLDGSQDLLQVVRRSEDPILSLLGSVSASTTQCYTSSLISNTPLPISPKSSTNSTPKQDNLLLSPSPLVLDPTLSWLSMCHWLHLQLILTKRPHGTDITETPATPLTSHDADPASLTKPKHNFMIGDVAVDATAPLDFGRSSSINSSSTISSSVIISSSSDNPLPLASSQSLGTLYGRTIPLPQLDHYPFWSEIECEQEELAIAASDNLTNCNDGSYNNDHLSDNSASDQVPGWADYPDWVQHVSRYGRFGTGVTSTVMAIDEMVFYLRSYAPLLTQGLFIFLPDSPLLELARFVIALPNRPSDALASMTAFCAKCTSGFQNLLDEEEDRNARRSRPRGKKDNAENNEPRPLIPLGQDEQPFSLNVLFIIDVAREYLQRVMNDARTKYASYLQQRVTVTLLRSIVGGGFLGLRKIEKRYTSGLLGLSKPAKNLRRDRWDSLSATVATTTHHVLQCGFGRDLDVVSIVRQLPDAIVKSSPLANFLIPPEKVDGKSSTRSSSSTSSSLRFDNMNSSYSFPLMGANFGAPHHMGTLMNSAYPLPFLIEPDSLSSQSLVPADSDLVGGSVVLDGWASLNALAHVQQLVHEFQATVLWEYPTERMALWREIAEYLEHRQVPARLCKQFFLGPLSRVSPPAALRDFLSGNAVNPEDARTLAPMHAKAERMVEAGVTDFRLSMDEHLQLLSLIAGYNEKLGVDLSLQGHLARKKEQEAGLNDFERRLNSIVRDPSLRDILYQPVDLRFGVTSHLAW